MKIEVSAKAFKDALKELESVMPAKSKTTLDILHCVKIRTEGNYAYVSASNLAEDLEIELQCLSIESHGELVLGGIKSLSKGLKLFKELTISIEYVGDGVYTVSDTSKKIKNKTKPANDFPKFKKLDAVENVYNYNTKHLHERLSKVKHAIGVDETRKTLMNVCFKENDIAAVDGYRLAISKDISLEVKGELIVPVSCVNILLKLMNLKKPAPITILVGEKSVMFNFQGKSLVTDLGPLPFIKYEDLIPREYNTTIMVDVAGVKDNIDFLSKSAVDSKNNLVKLDVTTDGLKALTNNEDGSEFETNNDVTSFEGEELMVGFNGKYLLDMFKSIDEEEVKMKFASAVSPMVMQPNDRETYLLLPVRFKPTATA